MNLIKRIERVLRHAFYLTAGWPPAAGMKSVLKSLDRFPIVALLLFGLGGGAAHADCSAYRGEVVFNEVQVPASGTTFFELRILNPSIVAATGQFANWKIDLYRQGSVNTSTTLDLSAAFINITTNNCGQSSLWIQIPDASVGGMINAARNVGDNLNFILYEPSGSKRIVDLLRLGTTTTSFYGAGSTYESCPEIETAYGPYYDRTWGSGGNKNWYRTPDGTGPWVGSATANNANSICNSNDATTPAQVGLSKSSSTATVNTNTNFSFTLYAQNPLTGTA